MVEDYELESFRCEVRQIVEEISERVSAIEMRLDRLTDEPVGGGLNFRGQLGAQDKLPSNRERGDMWRIAWPRTIAATKGATQKVIPGNLIIWDGKEWDVLEN